MVIPRIVAEGAVGSHTVGEAARAGTPPRGPRSWSGVPHWRCQMTLLRCTRWPCLITLCLATLFPITGLAQNARVPSRVPTPVLLKRLAEAVDGHRSGQRVWVVASWDSLHPVGGVFIDRGLAERLRDSLGRGWDLFGPFEAPRHEIGDLVGAGCVHDRLSSLMREKICVGPQYPRTDVDSMTLVLHLRAGGTARLPLRRDDDAIFLSMAAIDKFVIPYYAGIIGVGPATDMRARIMTNIAAGAASLNAPQRRAP